MAEDKERISAQVSKDVKTKFQIIANREDMTEADLLRQLVDERIEQENIPEDVINYFQESNEGNPKTVAD